MFLDHITEKLFKKGDHETISFILKRTDAPLTIYEQMAIRTT